MRLLLRCDECREAGGAALNLGTGTGMEGLMGLTGMVWIAQNDVQPSLRHHPSGKAQWGRELPGEL